jgi:hypothetical protein
VTILLWKVLDNSVVEACLGTAAACGGLTIIAILLPPSVEGGTWLMAVIAAVMLICKFIAALFRLLAH